MDANPTKKQIGLLQHAIGVDETNRDISRNHFVAGDGHSDMDDLEALVASGLMVVGNRPSFLSEGDVVFLATAEGKRVAITNLAPKPENVNPTPDQIGLLQHTIGIGEFNRKPYRNHFVADPGHSDMPGLEALVAMDLMVVGRSSLLPEGDVLFLATDAGKSIAMANLPPEPDRSKMTNYDHYCEADSGLPFHEWLGIRRPEYETRRSGEWMQGDGILATYRSREEFRMTGQRRASGDYVTGDWKPNRKEAKQSYKEKLKLQMDEDRRRRNDPAEVTRRRVRELLDRTAY